MGSFESATSHRSLRRGRRQLPALECLEGRALLSNITPSAVISSAPSGADFNYTIALKNASSSNAGIGTFWFAWVPVKDFLPTSPISVTPPVGWTDMITHGGPTDGFAIQFVADSATYYVQPGSSLDFKFNSADSPTSIKGDSPFYPGTPVGTSFVYPQGPFSDAGHQFVVTAAAPPTNPLVTVSKVTDVQAKHHMVTQITIAFSGPVNATEAMTLSEYRLVKAGKKGSFTAKNAKPIALDSAVYDAADDTVTLTPSKAFALTMPVELVINGSPPSGLHDTLGRLIDGNHNGMPGSNAVAVLSKTGVRLQ